MATEHRNLPSLFLQSLPESQVFQLARLEEDLSNSLGCVLGEAGGNAEAAAANALLGEFLAAHAERLAITETIRDTVFEEYLSNVPDY